MARTRPGRGAPLIKLTGRDVPARTRLFLFVHAGGRCEFDGCNRYLLEHHLTKADGVFAQMAHIWAFSQGGPRGRRQHRHEKHDLSNLMLLCPQCHKLVDDHPEQYTTDVLRKHKKAHEDRVFMLTDTKPDRHTVAVAMTAKIGERAVSVSLAEMQDAVAPRYLGPRDVVEIDLTAMPDDSTQYYWRAGADAIASKMRNMYDQSFESGPVRHVSVFALGPIPLLVFLGSLLSDKVPLTLFQRHRDAEGWRWKERGDIVGYDLRRLRQGGDGAAVALLLSLSGRVKLRDLPSEIDDRYSIYEITLAGRPPNPGFLAIEESLQEFRRVYMGAVREIVASHGAFARLHLFPALPAPVAVAIGRDLMPKRDPAVLVYDYDKRVGGFIPTLEVNGNGPE
jgi:hypothetical protein